MDYLELLEKYMRHVIQCESISFLDRLNEQSDSVHISESEAEELGRIEAAIEADLYSGNSRQ